MELSYQRFREVWVSVLPVWKKKKKKKYSHTHVHCGGSVFTVPIFSPILEYSRTSRREVTRELQIGMLVLLVSLVPLPQVPGEHRTLILYDSVQQPGWIYMWMVDVRERTSWMEQKKNTNEQVLASFWGASGGRTRKSERAREKEREVKGSGDERVKGERESERGVYIFAG